MLQLLYAWLGAAAFVASLAYFLFTYAITFSETSAPGATLRPILIDVALFTAFALHHSLFARTGVKRRVSAAASPALERSTYTWVASLVFIWVCWAWQPVPGVLYALPPPGKWMGFAVQAAGLAVTVVGSRALDVLDLAGVRQVLRREQDPRHTALQTTGMYRVVRHPIYFGWVLFVFGAPEMTMTRFTFAAVSTAYLAIAIPWEERALVATFGRDYERYRQQVRWRMLPYVY